MKSEYSIEEMVQSAAQRADREIQERRASAEGQCGICRKCQTGRRSRQTARAEEANNGASFTDENRPAKGWNSCCARDTRGPPYWPLTETRRCLLRGLGGISGQGSRHGTLELKTPHPATESLCATVTSTNRLLNVIFLKINGSNICILTFHSKLRDCRLNLKSISH